MKLEIMTSLWEYVLNTINLMFRTNYDIRKNRKRFKGITNNSLFQCDDFRR